MSIVAEYRRQVLSPLRYPGAKRLLLPALRHLVPAPVDLLVEPFCGGA
jgi:DNA adenine methylase